MKTPILSMLLTVCTLFVYGQQNGGQSTIAIEGNYGSPKVSPDLEHILMWGIEEQGLFLYSVADQKISKISSDQASTYGYSWDVNGEKFYFLEKESEEVPVAFASVKTFDLATNSVVETTVDVEALHLPSFTGYEEFRPNQIVVYNDLDDLQIYTMDLETREVKAITNEPGKEFYAPILSHDKTKVAVHLDNEIKVYSVDNSFEPYSLGDGTVTEWSSDDKYLLGFVESNEGCNELCNADIFLFDVNSMSRIQVTFTDDEIELFPSFYGDDMIIYSDEKSGTMKSTSIIKN